MRIGFGKEKLIASFVATEPRNCHFGSVGIDAGSEQSEGLNSPVAPGSGALACALTIIAPAVQGGSNAGSACRMLRESREFRSRHVKRMQQFRFRFQKERAGN